MVVSVTLGFMLYVFISVKDFEKDQIIWVIFVLVVLKGGFCLCVRVLSLCGFEC